MQFQRQCKPSLEKSFFLFGARGTGKTTLVRELLAGDSAVFIDLLDLDLEEKYSINPMKLLEEIRLQNPKWVIIDEIQKIPKLLNIVHKVIEDPDLYTKFALTGSSARKLKKGGANLLAGRALLNNLYPLTHTEIFAHDIQPNIDSILNFGTLPEIYSFDSEDLKKKYLSTYAQTYLREEIWDEHLVRNLDPFRKFLPIASMMSGEIINFSKLARESGVTDKSIKTYYQILEDTLIGFFVEPYARSLRKKQISSPKFYIFDTGVKKALSKTLRSLDVAGTYSYGKAFEHWLVTEFYRLCDYLDEEAEFSFLKTHDGREIDLIIERAGVPATLIEFKSSCSTSSEDARHLISLRGEWNKSECYVLSQDPSERIHEGVYFLPWRKGVKEILDLSSA